MLDFGWLELILIIAVAVIVIGPSEIPAVMVGIGRVFRRLQYVKFAVSQQFDDMMREADLDNIRNSVNFEAREDAVDEAGADEEIAALADAAVAARAEKAGKDAKGDSDE